LVRPVLSLSVYKYNVAHVIMSDVTFQLVSCDGRCLNPNTELTREYLLDLTPIALLLI